MKKLFFSFAVMAAIGLMTTACSQEGDTVIDPQPASRSLADLTTVLPDTSSVITPTRAMEIAAHLGKATPASRAASRVAESVEAVTDENGDPLIYVVNYTNDQGYVVLSASTAYTPILAQSDEGRFDLVDLDQNHPVNFWLDEQKYIVKHADALPDSIRRKTASEWMAYNFDRADVSPLSANADKPQIYYDSLQRWSTNPNIEVYTYEDYKKTAEYQQLGSAVQDEISNLLRNQGNTNYGSVEDVTLVLRVTERKNFEINPSTTIPPRDIKWQQEGGYNHFVPGQTKLGCTTVAVGQIMRVTRHPSYINWVQMPYNNWTNATAEFLYDIFKLAGIDSEGHGDDAGAAKAFNSYGYSTRTVSHSTEQVDKELEDGYCVYMSGYPSSGAGHAWMCSGIKVNSSNLKIRFMTLEYRPTTYTQPPFFEIYTVNNSIQNNNKYFYNWGYEGKYNGFFSDQNIAFTDSEGKVYNYNTKRVDIFAHPNN